MCELGGYSKVQDFQWGGARDLADGISTVTIAATGAGKSTIWQLLCLGIKEYKRDRPKAKKMVILLSVTKGTMEDQVDTLRRMGIDAHAVNGDSISEDLVDQFLAGEGELFAITPELLIHHPRIRKAFTNPSFRELVVAIIMDEAHTLRTWGTTFRPDLARLDQVCVELSSEVPWAIISATLPEPELLFAAQTLGLEQRAFTFRDTGSDRDELYFEARALRYTSSSYADLFFLLRPDPLSCPYEPPPLPSASPLSPHLDRLHLHAKRLSRSPVPPQSPPPAVSMGCGRGLPRIGEEEAVWEVEEKGCSSGQYDASGSLTSSSLVS
ncbi:hypothetical protein JCM11641_001949 [Rhodosporidiobolus odoratus]